MSTPTNQPPFSQVPPPPLGQTPPPPPPAFGQPPVAPAPPFGPPASFAPAGMQQAATTKPPRPAVPVGGALLVAGGALTIIGCVLNWFEVAGLVEVNGFTTGTDDDVNDGPFFTFLAVVLIGFGITLIAAKRVLAVAIIGAVTAALVILAGFGDYSDVRDLRDFLGDDLTVGPGLPVVILGGFVSLAGTILALAKRRR